MLMNIRKKRFQAGVAVVYFSLVLSFLMGFFMLAANTGRLVYHKMKLQSSVDLAAYSGAAVQASYLGSDSENSIKRINAKIQQRYVKLLDDIKALTYPVAVLVATNGMTGYYRDPVSCAIQCQEANTASLFQVLLLYEKASRDIQKEHQKVRRILQQLPEKIRGAVEETMRLNMPQFDLSGKLLGSSVSPATRELSEIMQPSAITQEQLKNAILTFSSEQGAYLANVVSSVPHTVPFLGPFCINETDGLNMAPQFYCPVNGIALPPGTLGGASLAFSNLMTFIGSQGAAPGGTSIDKISGRDDSALRLHFIENPHRPQAFVTVAAEYYPSESFMNLDNSSGGSVFNRRPRLAAVSAAEPFGTLLAANDSLPFGVRISGLRKLLLDPRMQSVKEDYQGLFDYFKFIGPKDDRGESIESAEETIKRFLH